MGTKRRGGGGGGAKMPETQVEALCKYQKCVQESRKDTSSMVSVLRLQCVGPRASRTWTWRRWRVGWDGLRVDSHLWLCDWKKVSNRPTQNVSKLDFAQCSGDDPPPSPVSKENSA